MTSSSSPPYLLHELIEYRFIDIFNGNITAPLKNILQSGGQLSSPTKDPTMILYIPFQGKVELTQILFDFVDRESCPKVIKFYVNQGPDEVDFENYEDLNEAQDETIEEPKNSDISKTIDTSENNYSNDKNEQAEDRLRIIKLKPTKFKGITSLHIVFESNYSSSKTNCPTKLENIQIYGKTFGRNESLKKHYIPEKVLHTRFGGYKGDYI